MQGINEADDDLSFVEGLLSRARGVSTRRDGAVLYVLVRVPLGVRALTFYAGDGNVSRMIQLVDQARGPRRRKKAVRLAVMSIPGVTVSLARQWATKNG